MNLIFQAKARLEVETECRRIIADNYEKVLERAKEYSKKLEAPILVNYILSHIILF